MTKEEFEQRYANESDMTIEEYHQLLATKPCNCESEYCNGWQAVSGKEG